MKHSSWDSYPSPPVPLVIHLFRTQINIITDIGYDIKIKTFVNGARAQHQLTIQLSKVSIYTLQTNISHQKSSRARVWRYLFVTMQIRKMESPYEVTDLQ